METLPEVVHPGFLRVEEKWRLGEKEIEISPLAEVVPYICKAGRPRPQPVTVFNLLSSQGDLGFPAKIAIWPGINGRDLKRLTLPEPFASVTLMNVRRQQAAPVTGIPETTR